MSGRDGGWRRWWRSPLVWFLLVNIPFLFVFYDVWNLNTIVYTGSFLVLGLNPYGYGNVIPGGLPIQLLGLGVYQVYQWSGANFLATAAVLKVVYLVLTYACGVVLGRVAAAEGLPYHRKIFLAFIFNPFVLFVNNVWVETDVIIIFLYVIGFAALRYGWDRRGEVRYLLVGALCLCLAIFSYYSIVLLVPTLLIFRPNLRRALETAAAFAGIGAVFLVPILLFGLTSLNRIAPALRSPSSGISPYSVFRLVPPSWVANLGALETVTLATTAALSVAIPVVLRRLGASEGVSLFFALAAALLLVVNNVPGDNFVLLTALVFLALIGLRRATLTYRWIFALQMFILPQLLIAQLLDGIGGPVGVFYWSYYQFHAQPNLYPVLGGRSYWDALLWTYLVLLALTITFFVRASLRPRSGSPAPTLPAGPVDATPPRPAALRPTVAASLVLVVLLAVLVPVGVGYLPADARPAATVQGFQPGLIVPYAYGDDCSLPPECAYQLSSGQTFQFTGGGSTVSIGAPSVPLGLSRNMTDQGFQVNLTASVAWDGAADAPATLDLFNSSTAYAGLSNAPVVANGSLLPPASSSEFSNVGPRTTTVFPGVQTVYALNGTGIVAYHLGLASLPGRELLFGVELSSAGRTNSVGEDTLWALTIGSTSYTAYLENGLFVLAYQNPNGGWQNTSAPLLSFFNRWYVSGFEEDPRGTTVIGFLNGLELAAPLPATATGSAVLNIGRFGPAPGTAYRQAIAGNVTGVFSYPAGSLAYRELAYLGVVGQPNVTTFPNVGALPIGVTGGRNEGTVSVGGRSLETGEFGVVWFGKLSDVRASARLTFDAFRLSGLPPGPNLFWVVLAFGALFPLAVAGCCVAPGLASALRIRRLRSPTATDRP